VISKIRASLLCVYSGRNLKKISEFTQMCLSAFDSHHLSRREGSTRMLLRTNAAITTTTPVRKKMARRWRKSARPARAGGRSALKEKG
jgi:ribosomal protein L4